MNKQALIDCICDALETILQTAKDSALRAHKTATDKESIAENKYDTFGLEASYLAHGQAARVIECEADLLAYQNLVAQDSSQKITIGSFVTLLDENEKEHRFFLGPKAGGVKVNFETVDIMIVTPLSPLGSRLLECSVGDEFELKLGKNNQYYFVENIQ